MQQQALTWSMIDAVAGDLGASEAARRKWRQRGVPSAWQVRIASELMRNGDAVDPVSVGDVRPTPSSRVA